MYDSLNRGLTARAVPWGWSFVVYLLALVAAIALASPDALAAKGGNGGGGGGKPGPFVKFSGTVTNSYTSQGVPGATVTLTATGTTITLTTDGSGNFSDNKVQVGTYTMDVSATNYTSSSQPLSLLKGSTGVVVPLTPVAKVIVNASVSGSAAPGASLTATGSYIIMDGSSFSGSGWSQNAEGVPATIGSGDIATVDLGDADTYAAHLIQVLKEPPITAADLPPDLVLQPINEIEKGLQDRNQVVAINPMAMEEGEALPLVYTVTTSSGTYTKAVSVTVALPWHISTGVRTVPVDSTVLLYEKDAAAYNWTISAKPSGSTAMLISPTTQTPWFTPDKVGTYTLEDTTNVVTIDVHAGRYHGVIDPLLTLNSLDFGDGYPVDGDCTGCHMEGGAAPPNFDTWRLTGHAGAFSDNVTESTHFGENCFACHTLGFGTSSGIDSTPSYDDFLSDLHAAQSDGDTSGVWLSMLSNQEDTARMANVQCENCHGPNDYNDVHPSDNPADVVERVSLSPDVCGSCHGEPARHGRFQQWQLSNHADYDLARERGLNGNCARCHSGNGFVAWSKLPSPFDPDTNVTVTWDEDTVVPQVCAACHNPHDTGTTSGLGTDAKVRVMGDTHELAAGFTATSVGKGATCMTCHNSRAGTPRNDATWASLSDSDKTGGPHHGVQADLIMGQNMYFFAPGELVRGKHSYITDTCITCHMEKTQAPDPLTFMSAPGTNHTFAANPLVCANSGCHAGGDPNAANIDLIITGYMTDLETALGDAYKRLLTAHYPVAAGGGCNTADGSAGHEIDTVKWNYGGHSGATLDISVSDGSSCTNRSQSSISVDGGANSLLDIALESANDAVLKARWNYGMNFEDETIIGCVDNTDTTCTPPHTHRGVHNPDFQIKSLTRAITAVQAVSP